METKKNRLQHLYELSRKNGLAFTKGEFSVLIGIDCSTLSHALKDDGKVNLDNIISRAENALIKNGISLSNLEISESVEIQPQSKTNSPTLEKCLDIIISQQEELRKQNEAQREMQDRLLSLLENKKGLQNTHASAV